ncbi:alpha/beta hydrolase domain-containing protein [Lentzea sp. JNUCC 0626]|uniref:alpha/beta hydrolase domain-containing protein n=1 Tax=Lentzea sp. JNUCC 0626 TaxID=3367513 RepID=UPI003747B8DF
MDCHHVVAGGLQDARGGEPPGAQFCFLFGTTEPFSQEQLKALHGSHGGFVRAWTQATCAAVTAGFLRPVDGLQMRIVGAQSDVLKP